MQAVLFDLDGTLIDTAPELAAALNLALQRDALALATPAQVRRWIGDGTRALLGKAYAAAGIPADGIASRVHAAWPAFEYDYAQLCGQHSTLYPGVRRMLERITGAGIAVGLVTNKETEFAHRLLVRHDLNTCFDLLVCGDTLPVRKPDPEPLLHAARQVSVDADRCVYVGDDERDILAARAAGMPSVAALWGYRLDEDDPETWQADVAVDAPQALLHPSAWPRPR